jgi:DNA polymerase gamma 1
MSENTGMVASSSNNQSDIRYERYLTVPLPQKANCLTVSNPAGLPSEPEYSSSEPNPVGPRRNAAGVQLLSPHLQQQIFPGAAFPPPPRSVIEVSLKHLADNELSPSGAAVLPEINFDLPPLQGNNIRDHFYRIGEQVAEPYLGLANTFATATIPKMPKEWDAENPGWTRYNADGTTTQVDDLGGVKMVCFDVEVLYKLSPYPVMATAATPDHWYSWLSPSIFEEDQTNYKLAEGEKRRDIPSHLTPISASKPDEPALIVGHNVGYDRARVKDEYHINLTKNRWLDTLSLHVATKGITSVQRPAWMKHRKAKKEKEQIHEETDLLIKETGDDTMVHTSGLSLEGQEDKTWEDVTSANSLAEVYRLHYGGKVDKSVRSRFGDDSITSASQLRPELQTLLAYCAEDVRITHAVLQKTLPLFLASCPHPASFAGALGMGNPFLPINKSWKEYLERAEDTYRQLEGGVKGVLWELAYRLKERGRVEGDPWTDQLDWTPKAARWNDEEVRGLAGKDKEKVQTVEINEGAAPEVVQETVVAPENAQEEPSSMDVDAIQVPVQTLGREQNEVLKDSRVKTVPLWLKDAQPWLRTSPPGARSGDPLPGIMNIKFRGFPIVESAEHRWIVQIPKTAVTEDFKSGLEGPLAFSRPEDLRLADQMVEYDFFKLERAGQPKLASVFSKRAKSFWTNGLLQSRQQELAVSLCSIDRSRLQAEITEAVEHFRQTGNDSLAGKHLDWTEVEYDVHQVATASADFGLSLKKQASKAKSSVRPVDIWPKWFWELAPAPSKGFAVGELDLTVRKKITPLLLRLQWKGHPLYNSREHGWLYRVPKGEVDRRLHQGVTFTAPAIEGKESTISSSPDVSLAGDKEAIYCKLPHPSGEEANVGNPLSKSFMRYIENGDLASAPSSSLSEDGIAHAAADAVDMNAQCSYWMSARERILSQMAVYQEVQGDFGISSADSQDQLGMILPNVITMGTVTRRAVESTWLTASNAKKNRVGSEVKAMIRAPPGYAIVGADVDSEELWIASVMGDAQFGLHGASAIGWMTLEGTKAAGTDLHSKTAKILKTKRDNAKVFNYSRIYGAGVKHAVQLLLQNDPSLDTRAAEDLAQALYKSTKGTKTFTINQKGKKARKLTGPRYVWHGGSESYLFNILESIASSSMPRTPALGCGVTDALRKKYLKDDSKTGSGDYLPSRINWVVQSSGVDYLHLLIVSMDFLIRRYGIEARYMISVHDELRYMVKEKDKYRAAMALQIANFWTRALFAYNLGMADLPQGVAFFSLVDIDHIFRKEVDMTCVTPSQPVPLSPGESVDIAQLLAITGGCLGPSKDDQARGDWSSGPEQSLPFQVDLQSLPHLRYLKAQASTESIGAHVYLASQNGLSSSSPNPQPKGLSFPGLDHNLDRSIEQQQIDEILSETEGGLSDIQQTKNKVTKSSKKSRVRTDVSKTEVYNPLPDPLLHLQNNAESDTHNQEPKAATG